jgi:hypothetical protein
LTKQQLINYLSKMRTIAEDTSDVRVIVGNLFYDIDHISTTINMDTNKPNIVIYVKEN